MLCSVGNSAFTPMWDKLNAAFEYICKSATRDAKRNIATPLPSAIGNAVEYLVTQNHHLPAE